MKVRTNRKDKWQGAKWIRPERRLAIYMRDDFTCVWCQRDCRHAVNGNVPEAPSLDHVITWIEGGCNSNHNLVTVCRDCNSRRADAPWRTFARNYRGAVARVEAAIAAPVRIALAKDIIANRKPSR